MNEYITRLANSVQITPQTSIEVVRLVEALRAFQPSSLAPDLPAPEVGEESGIADWHVGSWEISVYPDPNPDAGMVIIEDRIHATRPCIAHPIAARELGQALIAASDYAEKIYQTGPK